MKEHKQPIRYDENTITESLIVSVADCGTWMNIGYDGAIFHDALIESLIKSSQRLIEQYLWYDLNYRNYTAMFMLDYLDADSNFIIRKCPVFSFTGLKIEYLSTDYVWTEITAGAVSVAGSVYENYNIHLDRMGYPVIKIKNSYEVAEDTYNFRITFNSGYSVGVSDKDFTVTIATGAVFTANSHGLVTGDIIDELTTTGLLPTGLALNTSYYVIYVSDNTFCLATTKENALKNIKITTSGTQLGTHTFNINSNDISDDLKTAIKEIVEYNYINRGNHKDLVIPDSTKQKINHYSRAVFKLGGL